MIFREDKKKEKKTDDLFEKIFDQFEPKYESIDHIITKGQSLSNIFEKYSVNKDELELELIDGGAEEVELDDENLTVFTSFDQYGDMQFKLQELNITPSSTEIQQIPLNTKKLELTDAEEVLKIIDKFEEVDDIQSVFHNLELTEELIAKLEEN